MVQWNLAVGPEVLSEHYSHEVNILVTDVQRLNRTEALFLCAKLNLICSDGLEKIPIKGQAHALRLLANDKLIRKTDYSKLANKFQRGDVYPFARPGLLELMRWLSQLGSDTPDNIESLPHIQHSFLKAILSSSNLATERDITPYLVPSETKEEQRKMFLPGLRRALNWANHGSHPLMVLGRAWLLLKEEFFDKYSAHEVTFKAKTNLSIDQWFTCALGLITCTMMSSKQSLMSLKNLYEWDTDEIFKSVADMAEPFDKFVELLAQTPDEMAAKFGSLTSIDETLDFDFGVMRMRPILRIDRRRAIILDQRLFFESISAGPLFIVSQGSRDRAAFKDYGAACHQYALRLIYATNDRLNEALKAEYILNEAPAQKSNSECTIGDILFGDGTTLALCEAKGVWLNDKDLDGAEGEEFWQLIRNKYGVGVDPRTQQETRKGVAQLADLIKDLASGDVIPKQESAVINTVTSIIPILLVQDSLVATNLFAHFLALDFVQMFGLAELPATGTFTYGNKSIHTPIILSLRDLELLEGVTLDTTLVKLLEEFSAEVPDRADSLSIFLEYREPKLSILPDPNRLVKNAAVALLDRIAKQCFPEETR